MCGIFAAQAPTRSIEELRAAFQKLAHRGPDQSQFVPLETGTVIGFHRLAIRDTSRAGLQPFYDPRSRDALICNGDIYNDEDLRRELRSEYDFQSGSDCEVVLPLIRKLGLLEAARRLDAVFALVYYDAQQQRLLAARDPIGIRPLFYGYDAASHSIMFASEAKALQTLCKKVWPFPPGHIYDGQRFLPYRSMTQQIPRAYGHAGATREAIRSSLTQAVDKRLQTDRPLGCLLSGGLDSSLVAALATRLRGRPLTTFAIGCERDPIDLRYAAIVAEHIGSDHHEVIFSPNEVIALLDEVILATESWDTTTIRAALGMYGVCRYVARESSIRVLLTGEVSDELFGYKYTDFAPDARSFQDEAKKRVHELYLYDGLRADRCIAAHGLEARVPFGDLCFVDTVMAIEPELKLNRYGIGKYLLRHAFEDDDLLPRSILMREKAAFSDAVGHSMVDTLKAYAASSIRDEELAEARVEFPHATPQSKEALLYRRLFVKHFPGQEELIPAYWMPELTWVGSHITDPSARVLPNYGASGV